ncbi:hypothetical protein ABK040_002537 [Willaertia magna]
MSIKQKQDVLNSFILYSSLKDLQNLNSLNYISYEHLNKLKIICFNQQEFIQNNFNELQEYFYLKSIKNNYKTLQLNLKDLQNDYKFNFDLFVKNNFPILLQNSKFIISDNKIKNKENIFYKIKDDLQLLICIFEYLNTFDLINNISKVCKEFNEIIFYNKNNKKYKRYHLQLFSCRIINCLQNLGLKNINLESVMVLQKRYELKSFLQLYLYSGMFHLELFYKNLQKDFDKCINSRENKTYYFILNCNPLQNKYLNKSKYKTLIFTNSYDFYNKKNYKKRNFTIYLNKYRTLKSLNEYLLQFILECNFYELKEDIFTISFTNGIPLYLEFLQNVSQKIEKYLNYKDYIDYKNIENISFYFLLKMKEKANYFLQNIYLNHLQNFFVTDDVLIGLHLILLTKNYYNNLDNIIGINFTKLLQNRKLNDLKQLQKTTLLFPENMQINYFNLFTQHLKNYSLQNTPSCSFENSLQPITMEIINKEFKNTLPFSIITNPYHFLQRNIIRISKVYNPKEDINKEKYLWITEYLFQYKSIIRGKQPFYSPQTSLMNLFHQFYLLHPLQFLQSKKIIVPYFE